MRRLSCRPLHDGGKVAAPNSAAQGLRLAFGLTAGAFSLVFVCVLAMQWASGAFAVEAGGHPDEATHYVTGLMAREYLRLGLPLPPVEFAEQYYLRYPKLGIGHWPPAFYGLLGVWALLLGPGLPASLLMIALFAAATVTVLFEWLRRDAGLLPAIAGAAAAVSAPAAQLNYQMVMAEWPTALFFLGAVAAFGLYLGEPSKRWASLFGVLSAAALLTKATTVSLALVPVLSVVLLRRPDLLKRVDFWTPAFIVAAIAGPWYAASGWLLPSAFGSTADRLLDVPTRVGLIERLGQWPTMFPLVLLIPALIGAAAGVFSARRGTASGGAVAAAAALVSIVACQLLIPESSEPRHIFNALPLLAYFFPAGAQRIVAGLPSMGFSRTGLATAVLLGFGALFAFSDFRLVRKPAFAYSEAAEALFREETAPNPVWLVSSESWGEGVFVAEVARREAFPRRIVLRASKTLAAGGWSLGEYQSHAESPEQTGDLLDSLAVTGVVLDNAPGKGRGFSHHRNLREAVEAERGVWRRIAAAVPPDGVTQWRGEVVAYVRSGPPAVGGDDIRLDMKTRLGRVLELDPEFELLGRK